MKLVILTTLFSASISLAAGFDYNCQPIHSNVERKSYDASIEAQGYFWALKDKVTPDFINKKTDKWLLGQRINFDADNTDRWTGLQTTAADECFRHNWLIGTLSPNRQCTGDMFKQKTKGHAEITIHDNYCMANKPQNTNEMFTNAADLPADFINLWDTEYLTKNYSPNNISVAEKADRELDLFFQLNLETKKLWDDVLECEGGDAEAARLAIYKSKYSCIGIKEKLKDLVVNIANYFMSATSVNEPFRDFLNSKYVPGAISSDSPFLGAYAEHDGYEKFISEMKWDGKRRGVAGEIWIGNRVRKDYLNQKGLDDLYSTTIARAVVRHPGLSIEKVLDGRVQIHPLFSQIVMEIFAAQFLSKDLINDFGHIYTTKYAGQLRKGTNEITGEIRNLNNNIANFTLTYLEQMCAPTGLWPSAGFSALLKMQRDISKSISYYGKKTKPYETLQSDVSADYRRIGIWAFDHNKAQLNCIRGKVLPQIYYSDANSIIKHYQQMFRSHTAN